MGVIGRLFDMLFGSGRNLVVETVESFRPNAEKADLRAHEAQTAALLQFAQEFQHQNQSGFDRLVDGINRLPRPMMALGCVALFVAAMCDPQWFAARMQGLALVPEPLWWLLGVVVSFYFGARHQVKAQQFQADIARNLMLQSGLSEVSSDEDSPRQAFRSVRREMGFDENPALADWQDGQR